MGASLDLDDLVADWPEAKAELAELRAEVRRLRDVPQDAQPPCLADRPMNEEEKCQNFECPYFDMDFEQYCKGADQHEGPAAETCLEWKIPCKPIQDLRSRLVLRDVPPDARELVIKILCWTPPYKSSEERRITGGIEILTAYRARILDEAAERGIAWLKTLHHEPEPGLPWSEKIRKMQDLQVRTLRAAIKGAAHE